MSQVLNFMIDGNTDYDRNENSYRITSAWWYQHDFTVIASPKDLKAGDIVWMKSGKVGHVRIIIDVNMVGEEVIIVTAESTGASDVVGYFARIELVE